MSDKPVSLDPATLRWVMAWCDEYAGWAGPEGRVSMQAVAEQCRLWAAEAASRPPALSEWIRACEGTGLGEPRWKSGRHGAIVAHWGGEDGVAAEVCLSAADAMVWRPFGGDEERCATPADLRAALNRIANEAKP